MGAPKSGPGAKRPDSANQKKLATRTKENMTPAMLAKRDKFVNGLLQGLSKRDAAILAGCSPNTASKEGCHMYLEPYVQEQFRKLREALEEKELLTRKELILNVKSIAFDEEQKASDRVSASTLLSRMMGYDAPVKVDASVEHRGGVMVVPNNGGVDEWEHDARKAQSELKRDVRE